MQGTTLSFPTAPPVLLCCARRKGKQQQQLLPTHGDRQGVRTGFTLSKGKSLGYTLSLSPSLGPGDILETRLGTTHFHT